MRPPDPLHHTTKKKVGVTIHREHIHIAIIAFLVIWIIDKKLLLLPLIVLGLVAVIAFVLAPVADIKRVLGPSFFDIQWTRKTEVEYREVIKEIEVIKEVETIKEVVAPKPQHVYQDAQTQTEAPQKAKYVDQDTSTIPTEGKDVSTQTTNGIFVPTKSEQDAEMRRSQAMRDRPRRQHHRTTPAPFIDNIETDIERQHPPLTLAEHKNTPIAFRAPPSAPDSPANQPDFDPWKHMRRTLLRPDGSVTKYPYRWEETTRKNVFVSRACESKDPQTGEVTGWEHHGLWLFVTQDAAYLFIWQPSKSIWWCEDHGFGFYEEDPQTKDQFRVVYGDINAADPNMMGPLRTAHPSGPYYHDTVDDLDRVLKCQYEEWVREEKEKKEKERLEAEKKARDKAEKERLEAEMAEAIGKALEEDNRRMQMEADRAKARAKKTGSPPRPKKQKHRPAQQ